MRRESTVSGDLLLDTLFPLILFRYPLHGESLKALRVSGGSQCRTLPRFQSEEMKILNISSPGMEIEPTTSHVNSCTFVPLSYELHFPECFDVMC